jgi:hypothetical protein
MKAPAFGGTAWKPNSPVQLLAQIQQGADLK